MKSAPSDRSTRRSDATRGIVLLLVVVVGLALLFWDGQAAGADPAAAEPSESTTAEPTRSVAPTPAATPTRSRPRMPDLAGVRLDLAEGQLGDLERTSGVDIHTPRTHDLSPRDRSQWQDENWTVAATRPVAGRPLADGTDVHLFVLRNAEWAWFQVHPTMPPVPVDVGTGELTGTGQLLDGMGELLEYRYAPGHEPEPAAQRASSPPRPVDGLADDPSVEPAGEREERDALATAYSSGTLTVGSLPSEGTALRVGRLLTLTVREEPRDPAPPVSGGSDVHVDPQYSDDGDDDVDVPGSGPSGYTGCRSYAPGGKTWTPIPC